MRTRLASLIVVKQEPLSATSPPPPTPHPLSGSSSSSSSSFASPSSSCSSGSSSSSSSPPSSLFRSSLVVADGCDGLQCYGSFDPVAGTVEVKHSNRPTDGPQQAPSHAGLVAQYFCNRHGHGYGASPNGSGGDLNNNDPSSEEFEFFSEKKYYLQT
uniref:Uncharacterized protein n=1 Tax=Anopheles culicifacies TaxID=139723 RepID=A0A182M4B6_9DIPT